MFHFMTHAFFKALLFMGAGSVIGAMAGAQDMDKMGGFRRALPFTYICMLVGALALAGVPPFSGFFSKDEILVFVADRGGFHVALAIIGYIAAFMTAVYTFRMIFRAFWGEPVPEARELEEGHLHHPEAHTNPATGEVEDTDVGFPGPEHHIAEREPTMKLAMGGLAVLATIGGLVQIPHVTDALDHFLEPTFERSVYFHTLDPSDALTFGGMALGAGLALIGIALAHLIWVRSPGMSTRIRERFAALHELFFNKWYFDELIDLLIVRPSQWFGAWAQQTFERVVVNGLLVGGTSGVVRAGSSAVRAAQTGFLRYYAALVVVGLVLVAFYFLLAS